MAQVADFNIANASGASVRSDINAVLEAIKTNNSGGTDPTNAESFMFYADTADNNNLKIRNGANNAFTTIGSVDQANLGLLPRSGGTMTGALRLDDSSSSSSPALSFDGDTDLGIFRQSSNKLGVAVAGNLRFVFDDDGIIVKNGKAIRYDNAASTQHVALKAPSSLSSSVSLTLPSSVVNGGFLQTDGSGNLSFSLVQGVPTGSVFAMAVAVVPTGYVECDGSSYSKTGTYAALFAIIGTQYGGSANNFNVPDLRGEFVRGFDHGRGADSGRAIGQHQSGDNAQHTHSHTHNHSFSDSGTTSTKTLRGTVQQIAETFAGSGTTSGVFSKLGNFNSVFTPGNPDVSPAGGFSMNADHDHTFSVSGTTSNQSSNNTGPSGTTESRPRNFAMMYIIKI
jgi:microcystin-dependent protein